MIKDYTPKQIASAKTILEQGKEGDFWKIIVDALEENRQFLRRQLESDEFAELPPERYKAESEILRAKIKYIEELKATPENVLEHFENPDQTQKEYDPYES